MSAICIDAFNISLAKGSGIATYGRNLLPMLRALGASPQALFGPASAPGSDKMLNEVALADAEQDIKIRKTERLLKTYSSRFGRTAVGIMPSPEVIWPSRGGGRPDADLYWSADKLFYYAHRSMQAYGKFTPVTFSSDHKAPDVMQWTATLPLYARNAANIYTIHDLIPLRLPHATLERKKTYMQLCRGIASRADHIVVVSETTRQDVIRLLNVPEDRVTNTYQSVDVPLHLRERPQAEVATELEGIFNLGWKDYFLYFGAIEPKKNLGRIIEAYLASGSKTPLIIVGGRAWLAEGETALLNQVTRDGGPNAQRIRQYDYMPLNLLVSLIRGAKATLFPSLYEGFGLPVLESMQLETCVLTSTAGSLPEVAGDAAVLVDPYDTRAIARGIRTLDEDEALRANLQTRGVEQAALYSPANYQQRLGQLYQRLGVL